MALAIVIIVLVLSFAIEQAKAMSWKKDRLRKDDGSSTYTDYFGLDRDKKTNDPRFVGIDISGDRVMYDKNHNIVMNFSQKNEWDKFLLQYQEAKENGQRAIELDFTPSERNSNKFYAKKKYKDLSANADYIVIKGNIHRGMDLAHYYYDYTNRKVVCPSDGFIKRFNDPNFCKVKNTMSIKADDLSWDDVIKEIALLQKDIDENGLSQTSIIAEDSDYYAYFGKETRY